jgi:hypothetical protein
MSRSLGLDQTKVHGNTNSNTSKLAIIVSFAHICIIVGSRCNVGTKPNWYMPLDFSIKQKKIIL